jgi:transposase
MGLTGLVSQTTHQEDACPTVVVGSPGEIVAAVSRRWGWTRFAAAVRREVPRHGATRWYSKIVRAVFDAAVDPARSAAGVADQRAGALERTRFAMSDLAHARAEAAVVEARMVQVLDQLGLTALATSIPGLSAVGAAAILAETGDPTRFSSARALVKHAGLCPRDNASGAYQGKTVISGRGRPQLRLAAGGRCGLRCATTPCSPPDTRT